MDISEELSVIVGYARDEAMRTGHYSIRAEHLLLGILRHADNPACRSLIASGLDLRTLKERLDSAVSRGWSIPYAEMDNIAPSDDASRILNLALADATIQGSDSADSMNLLSVLAREGGPVCQECLAQAPAGTISRPEHSAPAIKEKLSDEDNRARMILSAELERIAIEKALDSFEPLA